MPTEQELLALRAKVLERRAANAERERLAQEKIRIDIERQKKIDSEYAALLAELYDAGSGKPSCSIISPNLADCDDRYRNEGELD